MSTNIADEYFTGTVNRDFFHLICGEKIDSGVYRTVYKNNLDPTTVIKFEQGSRSFCNAKEWQLWGEMSEMPESTTKWFAKCVAISPCGSIMIQQKTERAALTKYPDKIPKHFTDTKYDNFGFVGDQLVCHDYGNFIITNGLNNRLVKADWWE